MLNDRWVDMTKAYSALLDEDVRNNWMQYGHPDGKQSFSIGIALPKLIVTQGNGKYVLLFYAVVLGVALPYVVGRWWYGTQARTKDGVIIASAGKLFKEYREEVMVVDVVAATSNGDEFQQMFKGIKAETGLDKIEKTVVTAQQGPSERHRRPLNEIDDPSTRRALALLWAYLGRLDLDDATLEGEKYAVAPVAFLLIDSFSSIALAFGAVSPLLASYHASQHLIQALLPDASPLLQLPHFTPKVVHAIEGASSSNINDQHNGKAHVSVQKFMSLPNSVRRKLAADLSESQYATAMQVAGQMPHFVIAKAYFKVVGDKVVTPSALVQLVIKGRIIPPGSRNIPEVRSEDLEDVDPDEGDLEALLGRQPSSLSRRKRPLVDSGPTSGAAGNSNDNTTKAVQPSLAHAPYFSVDHSPRWRVFLTDARAGRIGVPPFTFTEFDKPIFTEGDQSQPSQQQQQRDQEPKQTNRRFSFTSSSSSTSSPLRPTFNMQTLKCQFQAPPQTGQFAFKLHLICDSYVGLDSTLDIILDVQNLSKAVDSKVIAPVAREDDISDPEEDSLAGQMNVMKGGKVKRPQSERKGSEGGRSRQAQDEEEEDESDTDGEVGDESETDTETDEE